MNILPGAACTVEEWASLMGSDLPRQGQLGGIRVEDLGFCQLRILPLNHLVSTSCPI